MQVVYEEDEYVQVVYATVHDRLVFQATDHIDYVRDPNYNHILQRIIT